METTSYKGIDYSGHTRVNQDQETGIRFGVIQANSVGQVWFEESEANYFYICPKCEHEIGFEFLSICPGCKEEVEESFYDLQIDPVSFSYSQDDYQCEQSADDPDIFVLKSPYFTYAQFCSPCAPGAVYLENPLDFKDSDNRGYCFGHDWFESEKAPYPVYSVETGKLVKAK